MESIFRAAGLLVVAVAAKSVKIPLSKGPGKYNPEEKYKEIIVREESPFLAAPFASPHASKTTSDNSLL